MQTLTLPLILLALAAGGCMKSASHTSYADAPEAADRNEGISLAGSSQVEQEYTVEGASTRGRGWGRGKNKSKSKPKRSRPHRAKAEMASPPPPASAVSGVEAAPAEPAIEAPRKDLEHRHIIYTASMQISVFNLQLALEKAEALPTLVGGYVQQMSGTQITLRIPAANLRPAMEMLGKFGVVEHRSLSTQDVSAEFVDVESRIRALEETHKQLLTLLGKARTVEEALHVRQALDEIATQLEVLKGRQRQLENLTAYSTLTLQLSERGPNTPTPSSNDPFPWVDSLGVEVTEWK